MKKIALLTLLLFAVATPLFADRVQGPFTLSDDGRILKKCNSGNLETVEIPLSENEKQKFHDAMEPLYQKYCAEYMDIVEQIRSLRSDSPD